MISYNMFQRLHNHLVISYILFLAIYWHTIHNCSMWWYLYKQVVDFTKRSDDQLTIIQQLETRLGMSFLETAAEEGKKDVVKHVLFKLQEEIKIISLTAKKHHEALQKSTSLLCIHVTWQSWLSIIYII